MTPEPKKEEPKAEPNLWTDYERRKSELPTDLKPFDYIEACTRIARELGI